MGKPSENMACLPICLKINGKYGNKNSRSERFFMGTSLEHIGQFPIDMDVLVGKLYWNKWEILQNM